MTPDEINEKSSDPYYRCFGCRATIGLHWYRETSCPVCSKPECIAQCDAAWASAMANSGE